MSDSDSVHRFMDSVLSSFVLSNIKTVLRAFLITARRTSVYASSLSLTVLIIIKNPYISHIKRIFLLYTIYFAWSVYRCGNEFFWLHKKYGFCSYGGKRQRHSCGKNYFLQDIHGSRCVDMGRLKKYSHNFCKGYVNSGIRQQTYAIYTDTYFYNERLLACI